MVDNVDLQIPFFITLLRILLKKIDYPDSFLRQMDLLSAEPGNWVFLVRCWFDEAVGDFLLFNKNFQSR